MSNVSWTWSDTQPRQRCATCCLLIWEDHRGFNSPHQDLNKCGTTRRWRSTTLQGWVYLWALKSEEVLKLTEEYGSSELALWFVALQWSYVLTTLRSETPSRLKQQHETKEKSTFLSHKQCRHLFLPYGSASYWILTDFWYLKVDTVWC